MDLLSDLLSFICAVVNSWAGYATGGVIMALVAFWAMFRQKQVPRSMGIGLAIIFLFFAFFHAWRDQHHAALQAQEDKRKAEEQLVGIEKHSFPDLKGEIIFSFIETNKDNPGNTRVVFGVSVTNNGAPSITKNWLARIDIPGRGSVSSIPIHYPRGFDLTKDGQVGERLKNSDAIFEKTAESPVTTGAEVHGWLLFFLKGVNPEELRRDGTVVQLTFLDVNGKQHRITRLWPIGLDVDLPPYVPGIQSRPVSTELGLNEP